MADGEDEDSKSDCDQCKFWEFVSDNGPDSLKGETLGTCHRYAPSPYQGDATDGHIRWPKVFAFEWCGDFAPIGETSNG